ncbi:phospholipase D-like domain-containing protein [Massilia sp. CCM 9210]|uniref:phospholipase D-like domain-containing protein n=1 Tax=Massilia scottii TaxID=3057166 RepID=UPI00279670FF|nr:phospholipase D-like domain-containing protein [Massilia sp. CCM 9210]MDQ1815655.1 phospholipase D-like domain-containing protein [Massilia sp. CCM 9210]
MKIQRARNLVLTIAATMLSALLILNFSIGDKQIDRRFERLYSVSDPQFRRTMGVILGPSLDPGNKVQQLVNGEQIFPAMLAAIRGARKTITFETYIFWSGSIGREFVDALTERARHGVRVHVLLDWIGGKLDDSQLEHLQKNGVDVRRYNSPRWNNLHLLNNRTHRKLLVVDGMTGFTGGVGIADQWRGDGKHPAQWRDTHFQVEGPVVGQMQSAFIDNWMQATGEVLHGEAYLPELPPVGPQHAQVFTSSPGGGSESMQLMYLLSITSAADTIRLSASYFVPDTVAVNTLVAAARRGVKVQIILPGQHQDWDIVRRASRATWGPLLRAGAEIYEYTPSMYHVKVMIIDDTWVSVGSTNFDARSFAINDEANLNIYDAGFAGRQVDIFLEDLRRSHRVTLHEWESRGLADKALDAGASLISSQL